MWAFLSSYECVLLIGKVMMNHASRLYLDHRYESDNREMGLFVARSRINTRDVFNYHLPPASNATRLPPQLLQRLCSIYAEKDCPNLYRPDNVVGKSTYQSVFITVKHYKRKHIAVEYNIGWQESQ